MKKLKLRDEVYDALKWLVTVLLPSSSIFYYALSKIWGFPYAEEVMATISAIGTFVGALIGISTINYNADKEV